MEKKISLDSYDLTQLHFYTNILLQTFLSDKNNPLLEQFNTIWNEIEQEEKDKAADVMPAYFFVEEQFDIDDRRQKFKEMHGNENNLAWIAHAAATTCMTILLSEFNKTCETYMFKSDRHLTEDEKREIDERIRELRSRQNG